MLRPTINFFVPASPWISLLRTSQISWVQHFESWTGNWSTWRIRM